MINPMIESALLAHIGVGDLPDCLNEIVATLQAKHYNLAIALEVALCAYATDLAKRSFVAGWDLAKHPEGFIFGSTHPSDQLAQELEELVNQ